MIRVTSHKFKSNLSHYLRLVGQGHRIVILRYDEPVAEIQLPLENRVLRASVKRPVPITSPAREFAR